MEHECLRGSDDKSDGSPLEVAAIHVREFVFASSYCDTTPTHEMGKMNQNKQRADPLSLAGPPIQAAAPTRTAIQNKYNAELRYGCDSFASRQIQQAVDCLVHLPFPLYVN